VAVVGAAVVEAAVLCGVLSTVGSGFLSMVGGVCANPVPDGCELTGVAGFVSVGGV